MSFLAPLFLLGGLAIAAPILFHLIRRTTKDRLTFSSLMFLQPTPPRVSRRNRLENIWLLILRCIVIALLAFGFSRPFLNKPIATDLNKAAGKRVVILLDTSASMQRETLWREAVAKAEAVLQRASVADAVEMHAFDRATRRLITFEQWNSSAAGERVALAVQRLRDLKPGWAGTDLGGALASAVEALEDAAIRDKENVASQSRQIVVISDFQEGGKTERLQGFDWPRNIEVILERVKARRVTNAGLQVVAEGEDGMITETNAGPRIRVANAGESKKEQFRIGWSSLDGKLIVGKPTEIYVPPGQSRVFQLSKKPEGASDRVLLAGDEQDFDNAVAYVAPKAERIKVLYLGNDPAVDPAQQLYYLNRAFPQTRRREVEVKAFGTDQPVPSSELASATLIVIGDAIPDDRAKAVREVMETGRTVLTILKSAAMGGTVGTLANVPNLNVREGSVTGYALLGQIDFKHPVFAPFADPRFSDFTKIHFWKHREISVDSITNARVVAKFDRGDPALVELPRGKGSLFILTSGWHPADSQLALSSKFVPLLFALLEHSGGARMHSFQHIVGESVTLPSGTEAQSYSVRTPDGQTLNATKGSPFAATDSPGVYVASAGGEEYRFAVNLAAEESRTGAASFDELERLGVPLKPVQPSAAHQEAQKRHLRNAELENQQKLWRWLIVSALMVIVIETLVAGWITRRASQPVATA